jgi:pimeloyl-ACP methyl ester carboxylesterase
MIRRPNRTETLSTFSKPVLFIIGEYDKSVPFKDSLAQTYLPPQAYMYIMRKSTHMGILEEIEKQITPQVFFRFKYYEKPINTLIIHNLVSY